jgi:HEXXH motif-containing protein
LITTHRLPEDAFIALANGAGDPIVIRHLREAQLSKHLMLLYAVAEDADGADPSSPATAAFRAGYRLLARIQAADPESVAWLLGLPHIGAWAHDCLVSLDQGSSPDFGYLACAAAAAAVQAGVRFELDVPVGDGGVLLPGLGCLHVTSQRPWIRLSGDGERLTVGEHIDLPCAALVPDDGSSAQIPYWRGTPLVRAVADGHTWEVLLETADRHLDRYRLPMLATMTAHEVVSWRQCIQSAWQVLVRHHGWAAGPVAAGVSVIVPLTPRSNLDSATTPAAFGAIATSRPPAPVIMAETLVHEFQHLKLCGLMDMLPLIEPCDERAYAPWRDDPRPAGGLLQGVYAHLGIARFWNAQRHAETGPDDILRAQVMYERWRATIEPATSTLLRTGCLTSAGVRFISLLRARGQSLESGTVPAYAREIAGEVALDHWLTWQLRHIVANATGVAELADAYQHGEPFRDQALPEVWIEEEARIIDSIIRSRFLNMRYLEPWRYRELDAASAPELSEADCLLVGGRASAAVQAYCAEISVAADPRPDAWTGLGLAIHRLGPMALRQAFDAYLPLMFEVHACLCGQGVRSDLLDLAAWFT